MPEGELPQQGSDRRRGVHPIEECLHPTAAHHVDVIDAVRPGAHARDQRGQLRGRVGRPGLDPRLRDVDLVGQQHAAGRSAPPASSPGPARHTTRDGRRRTPPTQRAKLCDTCTGSAFPNWADCCVRNTNHPSSEGTFLTSTPRTLTQFIGGSRLFGAGIASANTSAPPDVVGMTYGDAVSKIERRGRRWARPMGIQVDRRRPAGRDGRLPGHRRGHGQDPSDLLYFCVFSIRAMR